MSQIVRSEPTKRSAGPRATAVVYYSGSAEAARALAPADRVRFCNAKYWSGDTEIAGVRKNQLGVEEPILFGNVYTAPGCAHAEQIKAAYAALGVKVESLGQPAKNEAPKVAAVKSPKDLGWTLATPPELYVKKYPKGAKVALAKKILEELNGA